jgi:hypothetical protein
VLKRRYAYAGPVSIRNLIVIGFSGHHVLQAHGVEPVLLAALSLLSGPRLWVLSACLGTGDMAAG